MDIDLKNIAIGVVGFCMGLTGFLVSIFAPIVFSLLPQLQLEVPDLGHGITHPKTPVRRRSWHPDHAAVAMRLFPADSVAKVLVGTPPTYPDEAQKGSVQVAPLVPPLFEDAKHVAVSSVRGTQPQPQSRTFSSKHLSSYSRLHSTAPPSTLVPPNRPSDSNKSADSELQSSPTRIPAALPNRSIHDLDFAHGHVLHPISSLGDNPYEQHVHDHPPAINVEMSPQLGLVSPFSFRRPLKSSGTRSLSRSRNLPHTPATLPNYPLPTLSPLSDDDDQECMLPETNSDTSQGSSRQDHAQQYDTDQGSTEQASSEAASEKIKARASYLARLRGKAKQKLAKLSKKVDSVSQSEHSSNFPRLSECQIRRRRSHPLNLLRKCGSTIPSCNRQEHKRASLPLPRTRPYEAPYNFPTPISPEAVSYVQNTREGYVQYILSLRPATAMTSFPVDTASSCASTRASPRSFQSSLPKLNSRKLAVTHRRSSSTSSSPVTGVDDFGFVVPHR